MKTIKPTVLAVSTLILLVGCSSSTKPEVAPSQTKSHTSASSPSSPAPQVAAFTDPATVAKVVSAAAHDVQIVNSYDYRSLARYLPSIGAVATPRMRAKLTTTYSTVLKTAAPKTHAVQTAKTNDVGIISFDGVTNTARVLVFGQVIVTNVQSTTPKYNSFGVVVTMKSSDGSWRIDDYVSDIQSNGTQAPPGTPDLVRASSAASAEAARIITFRRASFAADYDKALAGATGTLHSDLVGRRTEVQTTITSGHFDLAGAVNSSAVLSVKPQTVEVMVTVSVRRSSDTSVSIQRLVLTMIKAGSIWLATALEAVGIS